MKAIPLVRIGILLPAVAFLEAIGARADRFLLVAGIPPAALKQREALIPLHQTGRFLESAARAEGIEDLGILVGQHLSIESLGNYGEVLRGSLTLRELLHTAVALHPLYASGGRVWLAHESDRVWLRHAHDRRFEDGRAISEQMTLMLLLQILRGVLGPAWRPLETQLPASRAPSAVEIDALAGVPIKIGAASTGIAIERSLLTRPLPPRWRTRAPLDPVKRELARSAPADDFARSVQQTIGTLLLDGYPRIEHTAQAVGLSVRTLQRRLSESRASYSRLVEQERFAHAVVLLEDPTVRITEIALELGYSDVANFSHAFRRWTGAAPRQFRRPG